MAKEIICEKKVVMEIFKLWYRVPDYQRPYVWDNEQVTTLLENIFDAYQKNPDAEYFLGNMVLKVSERKVNPADVTSPTYEEYELLDGQQRLTTIFLMLAVARDIAVNPSMKTACKTAIFQCENKFLCQPERLRIVFDIRGNVKKFIDTYIKPDDATNNVAAIKSAADDKSADISVRNMAKALLDIKKFLNNLASSEFEKYFLFFWQKVLLTYVATQELHDAFELFTVLNTGGVKLRNSDILKVQNLAEVPDETERKNFAGAWEDMEKYFGDDFDRFLSYIRTILVQKKADMTLLKEFEKNIYAEKKLYKGKKTFDYLADMFNVYQKIFDDLSAVNGNYDAANYLKLMTSGLETDYWTAATLSYCKKFFCDSTGYENFCTFLKLLDKKVSADWICSLQPTKRIENVNAVIKLIDKANSPNDIFTSTVFNVPTGLKNILQADVYGTRYAKYLMLKLDLLLRDNTTAFQPPPTISIEHILPQNPPADSQWRKDFTDVQRDEWTDKLGNLVLLSRRKNSSLGNRDYAEKKSRYFNKYINLFAISLNVMNKYNQWTLADLQKNHADVVEKISAAYA